ncbi:MAG: hypothetical protein KIT58_07405 [Planctomycetota bacterium]|nr:hypothetical protein [Planctomycetota bacterium]
MNATRESWELQPMPEARLRLPYERRFSPAELRRLEQGFVPTVMEEKWFAFMEADTLFIHRSWSGYFVFALELVRDPGGARVKAAWANGDPTQYRPADAEDAVRDLGMVVDQWLILRGEGPPKHRRPTLSRAPLQRMKVEMIVYGAKDTGEMGGGAAAAVLAATGPGSPAGRAALAAAPRRLGEVVATRGFGPRGARDPPGGTSHPITIKDTQIRGGGAPTPSGSAPG